MFDFIKKSKIKKVFCAIILACFCISIFIIIFPPKKTAKYSNDSASKEEFALDEGITKFTQYIKINVNNLNKLDIPLRNYALGEKQTIAAKVYNNDKMIYNGDIEFDGNGFAILFDNPLNKNGDIFKVEIQCNFDKVKLYKIPGDEDNKLLINDEWNSQALVNFQYGDKSAMYRVWYPVLLATLFFTLLGCKTNKDGDKNDEK